MTADVEVRVPRVIVRMPNWLGDVVLALPALQAVRRHFADNRLVLAGPAPLLPVFASIPGIDERLAIETGARPRALAESARRVKDTADIAILLTNSFASALPFWMAGVPERWGYRRGLRGPLLSRAVSRRTRSTRFPTRHHADVYLRLVEALGLAADLDDAHRGTARLTASETQRQRGAALIAAAGIDPGRPVVAIAPGAAYGGAKQYPPSRLAAALEQLWRTTPAACVLVGAAPDRAAGHEVESAVAALGAEPAGRGRFGNLIGRTTLSDLIGVLASSAACLSNDSGPMHVAAALGVHVTALFGPTDERATAPLGPHTVLKQDVFCRPCLLRECPIDHRCMRRIGAADVASAVAQALDAGTARGGARA
jgi:heptosyltransferase II